MTTKSTISMISKWNFSTNSPITFQFKIYFRMGGTPDAREQQVEKEGQNLKKKNCHFPMEIRSNSWKFALER